MEIDNIKEWIKSRYGVESRDNREKTAECKKIFACAYRIYDEASGAIGGPGGMLHMQEKLFGNRFEGIETEYIYRDVEYLVPEHIWSEMKDFTFKTKLVISGAGYFATSNTILNSIDRGDNALLICHDLGCAYAAYLLGLNYILIYHQQGSILNEIISVGEKAGEKERRILAEIEKTVVDNSIKVYFPSIGARQVFLDTSTNVWQWNNEKLSNIPLYNTIDRIDKKININSDIVGKVDNLGCETFLSVGDYNEDKGLDRIPILLAEYVRQTKKDIVWIVVGSVSNAKLYDVIKKKCELFGIRNILMDKSVVDLIN